VSSVFCLSFLPVARFFAVFFSQTARAAPSISLLVPRGSLIVCQSVCVYRRHPTFRTVGTKVPIVVSGPTFIALKLLLFRFGGG
jgi:hypothetical protein